MGVAPHPAYHSPLLRCHFNAGCCCVEGGRESGAPRATADWDPHHRLTRVPLARSPLRPRASQCAPAPSGNSGGSAAQDGSRPGGSWALAAGGHWPRRGGGGARAGLQRGCAELVRHQSEPVSGAAPAPAGAARSRPRRGSPGVQPAALQPVFIC